MRGIHGVANTVAITPASAVASPERSTVSVPTAQPEHRPAPLDHALQAPARGPLPAARPPLRQPPVPLRARRARRHGGRRRTGRGPRHVALAGRQGPHHREVPAPAAPGRRERLLLGPSGRVPPAGGLRPVAVVVGAPLCQPVRPDRPARRPGCVGGGRQPDRLLLGVRPLDRDLGAPGEEAHERRGPPGGLRARLLDLLLLRPPAPGGRRPPGPGTSNRARRDGRPGADTAAARGHLGAIGYESARLRLAEVASVRIPSESEERIAETQAYRRRAAEQWRRA